MPVVPTLGYRSRTDAVLALRAGGMTTREIADAIGIEPNSVTALEASAKRRSGERITQLHSAAEPDRRTVVFARDVLSRLRLHASRRGITPNELIRRLVETALDDDMIDAVLDDRPDQPAEAAREQERV